MGRQIEAHIIPVEGDSRQVNLTTITTERHRFRYIGAVSNVLWRKDIGRTLKFFGSLALAATTATELSKPIFPLISADLTPLNSYPVLDQLSRAAENPIGVGILAAIGTYAFIRSAYRDAGKYEAIRAELQRVRLCLPPTERHEHRDDNNFEI